jgi:hypothetical protein
LDSLGDAGVGDVEELAAPPAELEAAEPVPGVVVVSPGAGEGVGGGVGEAVGALGAGGGVVTVFSSFLQAVRATAMKAAMRSERVILYFPLEAGLADQQRTGIPGFPTEISGRHDILPALDGASNSSP